MKIRFVFPMVALLAIGGTTAFAQTAGEPAASPAPITEQMNQRFQQMSTMMRQAQNARGARRMQLMREHMRLMRAQMQAMRSMMGDNGMMGGMSGGGMGANGMMGGNGKGKANAQMLAQMQARMDMMQRMMKQMLDQQNMMMRSAPTK